MIPLTRKGGGRPAVQRGVSARERARSPSVMSFRAERACTRPVQRCAGGLFAVLLVGCHPASGPRSADLGDLPEPAALLASLRRQADGRTNLRALGRVTARGPDGRIRLRAVLVAERPGRFRFETLTPFEQPIDVMTSDGARLWFLHEGRLYEGEATPDNVARLLPLPMTPPEVVETLLGGVPVSGRFEPVRVEPTDDGWWLRLEGPGGEQGRLLIEPSRLRVLEARLSDSAGKPLTRVEFDRFAPGTDGGPSVATSIEVRIPPRELEVRIRFTDVETGVDLPSGLFVIDPPPGVRPEPLGTSRPPAD